MQTPRLMGWGGDAVPKSYTRFAFIVALCASDTSCAYNFTYDYVPTHRIHLESVEPQYSKLAIYSSPARNERGPRASSEAHPPAVLVYLSMQNK